MHVRVHADSNRRSLPRDLIDQERHLGPDAGKVIDHFVRCGRNVAIILVHENRRRLLDVNRLVVVKTNAVDERLQRLLGHGADALDRKTAGRMRLEATHGVADLLVLGLTAQHEGDERVVPEDSGILRDDLTELLGAVGVDWGGAVRAELGDESVERGKVSGHWQQFGGLLG